MSVVFEDMETQREVSKTRLDKLPRPHDRIRLGSGWWSVVKVNGAPFSTQTVVVWVERWFE